MGKEIHKILDARGHEVSSTIDANNSEDVRRLSPSNTDVAIEFSSPKTAFQNITSCISNGVKVISGTTGWLERLPEVHHQVNQNNGTFFYASNFSLGVNLFFHLNSFLATLMKDFEDYKAELEEIHHTEKLDQPSGTAITLAEGVIKALPRATNWINQSSDDVTKLGIVSKRMPSVPGTHTVKYQSEEDLIEIKHTAASRKGFALGAVKVAEWIQNETGLLSMQDYLKLGH